jgi:hypothetical protein
MTDQETILKATKTAEWLYRYKGGRYFESFLDYLIEIREHREGELMSCCFGFNGDLENYLEDEYGIWIEEKWDSYYVGSFGGRDHFFNCYLRYLRSDDSEIAEKLPEDFRTEDFNIFQKKIKELWDIDSFLDRFFIFVDFKCSFDNKKTSESLWIFIRNPVYVL